MTVSGSAYLRIIAKKDVQAQDETRTVLGAKGGSSQILKRCVCIKILKSEEETCAKGALDEYDKR